MKNLRAFTVIVLLIIAVDFVTASDPLQTFEEAFILTIIVYAAKGIFDADPYALAGTMEYLGLILWLFSSIFWNLYIIHNYSDQSAAYAAAVVSFMVPAIVSALGIAVAGVVIETARKFMRSM